MPRRGVYDGLVLCDKQPRAMTVFGHAALGATVYGVLRPHAATTRWGLSRRALLLCCLLLPVVPDLDAIMHIWVKYGHALGHRGVSHSLLFGRGHAFQDIELHGLARAMCERLLIPLLQGETLARAGGGDAFF